jgi:hypothetical protein
MSPNPAAGAQTTTMVTNGNDVTESDAATTTYTAVVSGQCSGNAVSATDLAKASVDASAQANAEGVKPPTGLYEFECGAGHMLKASPETITLSGADANAKKAVCCDANANKASGDECDFRGQLRYCTKRSACTTGEWSYGSTANPSCDVAGSDYRLPDTLVCCLGGKCSGNAATATDLAEEADDETFQFACGDGKTLKPSASQITGKTIEACCDDASCKTKRYLRSFFILW